MSNSYKGASQNHPFHLVSPSPWPIDLCIIISVTSTLRSIRSAFEERDFYWGPFLGSRLGNHILAVLIGLSISNLVLSAIFSLPGQVYSFIYTFFIVVLAVVLRFKDIVSEVNRWKSKISKAWKREFLTSNAKDRGRTYPILKLILRMIIRTLLLRISVYVTQEFLLWLGFTTTSVVYNLTAVLLCLYYMYIISKMLKGMSLLDALLIFVLTFVLVSGFLHIVCWAVFVIFPDAFSFDVVSMLKDGASSSDTNSSSGSSSSSDGGTDNDPSDNKSSRNETNVEEDEVPDLGQRALCEHTGHWYPLPDQDTFEDNLTCDFGGTPGVGGKGGGGLEPHSAYYEGMPVMLCNSCNAISCYDCVNLPDDLHYAYQLGEAGPSVQSAAGALSGSNDSTTVESSEQSGNGVASSSNESTEKPDVPKEDSGNLSDSNNTYSGKGKGRA